MDSVESRDAAHRASEQVSEGADSRASWRMAWLVLAILSISYASPLVIVVGMKPMQEALGTDRSVLALAGSLVWVGTGSGGILMGWLADRIGLRRTVAIGAVMIAAGLALSSAGAIWTLYVGHALLGFLGNGGVYPPLLVYVSRWFERRRGAAIALISSGQYVAGVVWPFVFERGMTTFGWQAVMLVYGVFALVVILPATLFLKAPPKPAPVPVRHAGARSGRAAARRRPASQRGAGADLPRRFLLLHSDVDTVGAYRRLLRRSRHQADAWRGDAVADAGVRLPLAPGLGRAGRPDRRPAHGDGGLGLPGGRDRPLPADPGRGRAVLRVGGVRLGLRRHHPVLQRGGARSFPGLGGVVAHAADLVHGDERHGVRQLVRGRPLRPFRLLRAGLRHRA